MFILLHYILYTCVFSNLFFKSQLSFAKFRCIPFFGGYEYIIGINIPNIHLIAHIAGMEMKFIFKSMHYIILPYLIYMSNLFMKYISHKLRRYSLSIYYMNVINIPLVSSSFILTTESGHQFIFTLKTICHQGKQQQKKMYEITSFFFN